MHRGRAVTRRLVVVSVVVLGVLGVGGVSATMGPAGNHFAEIVSIGWAATLLLSMVGGGLFLGAWRRNQEPAALWLGLATWTAGCGLTGMVVVGTRAPANRVLDLDVAVAALTLLLLNQAARSRPLAVGARRVGLGLLIGTGLVLGQASAFDGASGSRASAQRIATDLAICLLGLTAAHVLRRLDILGVGRHVLALAGCVAVVSLVVTPVDPTRPGLAAAIGVLLAVLAATFFAQEAWLLHSGSGLAAVAAVAADQTDDPDRGREQLHEVRASMAGVAGAVHLLLGQDTLPRGPRRQRVEGMLHAEVARLQRLLEGERSQAETTVDLDEVLDRLVTARRLAGQQVDWQPSGLSVRATSDVVVEVLNILLVNAATHAPGARVHVETDTVGASVRIRVRDEGPGFARNLRRAAFERGVRGPSSPGQGIGLGLARRLASSIGGNLSVAAPPHDTRGACLVFTAPAAPQEAIA